MFNRRRYQVISCAVVCLLAGLLSACAASHIENVYVTEGDVWTACVWQNSAGSDCVGGSSSERTERLRCAVMTEQAARSPACLEATYYLAVCQATELDIMVLEEDVACHNMETAIAHLNEVCGDSLLAYQEDCAGVFDP